MRIDELDPKHTQFKQVILDQDLTEQQLNEILPVVGAVAGGIARGVGMAAARGVGALARGAGAVARGVGSAVGTAARGIGQAASNVGRGIGNATRNVGGTVKQQAKNQINKKVKSFAQDTADKLANQGDGQDNQQSNQQTIGQNSSSTQQTTLARGSEISVPVADPKNPNKTVMTPMKVKSATGSEVKLQPSKKISGIPDEVKFNRKDLAF